MATAAPTALALAIAGVRRHIGSHDKLVAVLREQYGLEKASRQLAINWEQNAIPSGRYREALIDLGVESALFAEPDEATTLRAEVTALREQVAEIRELLVASLDTGPKKPEVAEGS